MLTKPLFFVLLGLLVSCSPLPTKIYSYEPARPVEPMPYEKQGYVLVQPSSVPELRSAIPARIVPKPGAKLSETEISQILAQAEDKAIGAVSLSRSAQSKEDWSLVIEQWKRAIDLLKPVAKVARIQPKLIEYQRNLATAQIQAKTNPRQIVESERSTSNGIPLVVTETKPQPSPTASASPSPSPSPSSTPSSKL